MKTTLPTPAPTTPVKQDPFKRLSLAVKKLDQLINRTHQLGTFTNQLLREDTTGPSQPYSETKLTQALSPRSSTTVSATEELRNNIKPEEK